MINQPTQKARTNSGKATKGRVSLFVHFFGSSAVLVSKGICLSCFYYYYAASAVILVTI